MRDFYILFIASHTTFAFYINDGRMYVDSDAEFLCSIYFITFTLHNIFAFHIKKIHK